MMMGFRGTPGESYRPANGSEGEMFTARWCDRCTKDLHALEGGGCLILLQALIGEYPSEWTYDIDGNPSCASFDPCVDEVT